MKLQISVIFSTLFIVIFSFPKLVLAQAELSSFTATGKAGTATTSVSDYQCLGINPANLAWKLPFDEKRGTIGFFELGFSAHSDAMNKSTLKSAIFNSNDVFSNEEKTRAAIEFAGKGLSINADFMYGGIAFQSPKGGQGFAFNVRERMQWYAKIGPTASELLFKGYRATLNNLPLFLAPVAGVNGDSIAYLNPEVIDTNSVLNALKVSNLLEGTNISYSWTREFNAGYGLELYGDDDMQLGAGVGFRLIQSMGYVDVKAEKGNLRALAALSPGLEVNFPKQFQNPSVDSINNGFMPDAIGNGFGFDVGFSFLYKEKLRVGIALNNIGNLTYRTNVYQAYDSLVYFLQSDGFQNFDFIKDPKQFESLGKGLIGWEGKKEIRTTLPSNLRMGASYSISEKIDVGGELMVPLNNVPGNIGRSYQALGVEFKALPWLRLSGGVIYGGNFFSRAAFPAGIVITAGEGSWDFGIATRDFITYFRQKSPIVSLSTGFLRFRF